MCKIDMIKRLMICVSKDSNATAGRSKIWHWLDSVYCCVLNKVPVSSLSPPQTRLKEIMFLLLCIFVCLESDDSFKKINIMNGFLQGVLQMLSI